MKSNKTISSIDTDISEDELKHFGYDIFFNNPELFQDSQDFFVDPSHVIGPGDEIIIMLWGDIEINSPYIVSKDGYVFIENIGQVFVNGLTLSKLEKKLFNLLKKVYSTLDSSPGNATTFLDVSLGTYPKANKNSCRRRDKQPWCI